MNLIRQTCKPVLFSPVSAGFRRLVMSPFTALLSGLLLTCGAPRLSAVVLESEDLFFQEIPTVVTASRRPQAVMDSPLSVEVITREEIEASGAVNIWDLLRFRAGMDVVEARSVEGNRASVSIRGFTDEFVKSLQVLLDGRSVYSGFSGGVYWNHLPVQIQDIERIEIVRGPNAALYGSNAGLGVINIITKKPSAPKHLSAAVRGGNRRMLVSQTALEASGEKAGGRLSHTYRQDDGFNRTDGRPNNDFLKYNKGNFRGWWEPRPETSLEFIAGGQRQTQGLANSQSQGNVAEHFEMLRFTQETGEDASAELMTSISDGSERNGPTVLPAFDARRTQYDAEFLHRFSWDDRRLNTVWGGSYRYYFIRSEQLFSSSPDVINRTARGYLHQSVRFSRLLTVTGAVSIEKTDTGGLQTAYQTAAISNLTEDQSLRFSYSMAPTIPPLADTHSDFPSAPGFRVRGNPNLTPQELISYEAGYQGQFFGRGLGLETNLYYMQVKDIVEIYVEKVVLAPVRLTTFGFGNNNDAIARGAEVSGRYRLAPGKTLYANYTFQKITDRSGMTAITEASPEHKFNTGFICGLPKNLSMSLNAGYKSAYRPHSVSQGASIPIAYHWRLDAKLSWKPVPWMEAFIAGQNLAAPDHVEFPDNLDVARTYAGGIAVAFGRLP